MRVRARHGRWTDRFCLYIRHGSRKNFHEFLDRVDNEGKQPSNVIVDLCEEYIERKPEKHIKETETLEEKTGNIEKK